MIITKKTFHDERFDNESELAATDSKVWALLRVKDIKKRDHFAVLYILTKFDVNEEFLWIYIITIIV